MDVAVMDLFKWQFSKQVQPELDKFILAVYNKQKKCEDNYTSKPFQQLFRELTKEKPDQNKIGAIDNAGIITTVDDDEANKKHVFTDVALDVSVVNLASSESEEKVLNPDMQDFIAHIQEILEIENGILHHTDVHRLATECDEQKLEYLFTSTEQFLTDHRLLNLNQSLCDYSGPNKDIVVRQFCKTVLLKKFTSTHPTPLLTSLLKEFNDSYPDLARTKIFIPLLMRESSKWHEAGLHVLSELEIQCLLKDFLFSCSKLEVWHLSAVYVMLTQNTEESVKRRLINLLEASAVSFCNEKQFMRLFTSLVQKLGKGFEDQKEVLYSIVQTNKTILRTTAREIINEWEENNRAQ